LKGLTKGNLESVGIIQTDYLKQNASINFLIYVILLILKKTSSPSLVNPVKVNKQIKKLEI